MILDPEKIQGYHAHVYFDSESRDMAISLREPLNKFFHVTLGKIHENPIGPHPQSMYQVAFKPGQFSRIVPWLMLNRQGLSVLVHPNTGRDVEDHKNYPLWLGRSLLLDLDKLTKS